MPLPRGVGDCVAVAGCWLASVFFDTRCGGVICGVGDVRECGAVRRME